MKKEHIGHIILCVAILVCNTNLYGGKRKNRLRQRKRHTHTQEKKHVQTQEAQYHVCTRCHQEIRPEPEIAQQVSKYGCFDKCMLILTVLTGLGICLWCFMKLEPEEYNVCVTNCMQSCEQYSKAWRYLAWLSQKKSQ